VHQRVIREAATLLAPGGALLFEFGQGQDRQLAALLARARGYGAPRFVNDAAGVPRVVVATRT
jgi:release factor glutamine methyltransferase